MKKKYKKLKKKGKKKAEMDVMNARNFMVLVASEKTEHILFLILPSRSTCTSLSEFQS